MSFLEVKRGGKDIRKSPGCRPYGPCEQGLGAVCTTHNKHTSVQQIKIISGTEKTTPELSRDSENPPEFLHHGWTLTRHNSRDKKGDMKNVSFAPRSVSIPVVTCDRASSHSGRAVSKHWRLHGAILARANVNREKCGQS